jgi:hypothetical protein
MRLLQYGLAKEDVLISYEPKQFKTTYAINASPGQNGCPIVVDSKIMGIHIGNAILKEEFSVGRLITSDLMVNLSSWMK